MGKPGAGGAARGDTTKHQGCPLGRGQWDSPDHAAFWTLPAEPGRRAARATFLLLRDGHRLQSKGSQRPVFL